MEDKILEPGQPEFHPALDATFNLEEAVTLYRTGFLQTHPERLRRAEEDIRFDDVVERLTGFTSITISCPFHGRDSTPSFHLYRTSNDGWCFGCPPGQQYYNSILFVAKKLGVSREAALRWIEKEFDLPYIADVDIDEKEDDEEPVRIHFRDLLRPYVEHAAKDVQTCQQVDVAKDYLEDLFNAWPSRAEEKADPNAGDPKILARVLGPTVLAYIRQKKAQAARG